MCIPNTILQLRKNACDVLSKKFVHPCIDSPIWCNPTFNEQTQINKESNICKSNCLPMSMAVYNLLAKGNCNSNCKYRVVIGEVISKDKEGKLTYRTLKEVHGIDGFDSIPWHAWLEVSEDNFKTTSIIDLVYGATIEQFKSDNFNTASANKHGKQHIRIMSKGKDVMDFYRRLHLTCQQSSKVHDIHMNVVNSYIQPDKFRSFVKSVRLYISHLNRTKTVS